MVITYDTNKMVDCTCVDQCYIYKVWLSNVQNLLHVGVQNLQYTCKVIMYIIILKGSGKLLEEGCPALLKRKYFSTLD